MKSDIKKVATWVILAFIVGFSLHAGTKLAMKIWPTEITVHNNDTVEIYHHYNFNSVTQEWEEK